MNGLLPSPTLIDLSLRRDLHLIIVLQVTASVPESFVEIGVWGGKKKKSDKCPDERKGSCGCVRVGRVCQFSFRLSLPALTSLSCFLGYQHIQANQSARFKHGICVTATYFT